MRETHAHDADDDERDGEEVAFNEDPDSADIDALDHESAFCPDCGAEVWDAVEVCPKCFAYIGGNTLSREPGASWLGRRWLVLLITALLIVGLIYGCWL